MAQEMGVDITHWYTQAYEVKVWGMPKPVLKKTLVDACRYAMSLPPRVRVAIDTIEVFEDDLLESETMTLPPLPPQLPAGMGGVD